MRYINVSKALTTHYKNKRIRILLSGNELFIPRIDIAHGCGYTQTAVDIFFMPGEDTRAELFSTTGVTRPVVWNKKQIELFIKNKLSRGAANKQDKLEEFYAFFKKCTAEFDKLLEKRRAAAEQEDKKTITQNTEILDEQKPELEAVEAVNTREHDTKQGFTFGKFFKSFLTELNILNELRFGCSALGVK